MPDRPTERPTNPRRDRRARAASEAHGVTPCASPHAAPQPDAISLTKHGETFVFHYQRGHERRVLDEVAKLAADPDCPLDWYDAAWLSHELGRRLAQRCAQLREPGASQPPRANAA